MKPSPDELIGLRATFEALVPMPDDVWSLGADLFEAREIDADGYLLRAGEVSHHIYFVVHGVLRQFYLTSDGKEFNKSFSAEGEPCGAFHSSGTGNPSRFSIQALEPTRILQVRSADLMTLFDRNPLWERIGRKAAEGQMLVNEDREAQLLLDSATERYMRFQHDHPGLEERIAQYHVASYIGITNVALSRIRRKLRGS